MSCVCFHSARQPGQQVCRIQEQLVSVHETALGPFEDGQMILGRTPPEGQAQQMQATKYQHGICSYGSAGKHILAPIKHKVQIKHIHILSHTQNAD